jgi:hypothetical protein
VVAEILADAGLAYDDDLGLALESLRALCPAAAPKPSGALAELLALGTSGSGAGTASSRASRRAADVALEKLAPREPAVVRFAPRKRHRGAIISAAVVAGVGLGASGVAALGGVDYSADGPQAVGPVVTAPLANGPDIRPQVPVSTPQEAPVPAPSVGIQSAQTPAPAGAKAVGEAVASGPRHRATPADEVVAEAAVAVERVTPAAPAVPAGRHVAAAVPAPDVVAVQNAAARAIAAQVSAAVSRAAGAAQAAGAAKTVAVQAAGAARAAVHAQAARSARHVWR